MCTSIPALGVIVCASQKGRALVLGLTKVPSAARLLYEVMSDAPPATRGQTTYTMRVECILPFATQERVNQRPFAPLHGIATAPMQGSDGISQRRWRLMMMYQDHSVLSYEICRRPRREDGAGGVDVDSLVV